MLYISQVKVVFLRTIMMEITDPFSQLTNVKFTSMIRIKVALEIKKVALHMKFRWKAIMRKFLNLFQNTIISTVYSLVA